MQIALPYSPLGFSRPLLQILITLINLLLFAIKGACDLECMREIDHRDLEEYMKCASGCMLVKMRRPVPTKKG